MTLIAWLIYIPLQIIWLPFSFLGALWVAYKQVGRSKALGLSQTAWAALGHLAPTRPFVTDGGSAQNLPLTATPRHQAGPRRKQPLPPS